MNCQRHPCYPLRLAVSLVLLSGAVIRSTGYAVDAAPKNLARDAKISATSERTEQKLVATSVADGRIAPQGSGMLEFLPEDKPAQSWAVNGEEAKGKGELRFQWEQPVEVDQIVYFGRTPWLVQECFKDYEIYLNDDKGPVAKGTFEMKHGPQRIRFPRTSIKRLAIRFLNSYGGPNPGAAEVLVLGEEVSDRVLAALAPADPPTVPAWKKLAEHHIVWNSPSQDEERAMPLGNSQLLANVWIEKNGDLLVALGQVGVDEGQVSKLGRIRIRLDPPLNVAGESLRQTLMFSNGAVEIVGQANEPRPIYSIWVDANHPTLNVQLRCQRPVGVRAMVEGLAEPAVADKDRLGWRQDKTGCVMLAVGMKPEAGVFHSEKPAASFDLQVHVVSSAGAQAELDKAMAAVAAADIKATVQAHLQAWRDFWGRASVFVGGQDGKAISTALLLRRFLSASSGRGPHQLKPLPATEAKLPPKEASVRWPEKEISAALQSAAEEGRKFMASGTGSDRIPHFWGQKFQQLPQSSESIDLILAKLRSMLVGKDGQTLHMLPGWPVGRDVAFRLALPEGVRIETLYSGGEFASIEVWPKQRTGNVIGAGPFAKKVRRALPGYHVPALISFLSPSWVAERVGADNLAVTMKNINFNGYEGNISDLKWCKKNNIFLIVHGVNPWTAHTLKGEPNVISYFMADRNKPHAFPHFGNIRRQYEQIDPTHPTEFNTYAQWGGIEHFVDVVRPRLLEYYDYHWQRRADLHFHYLEYYRRMSIAAGRVPVYRFVHVHGDNPIKMRQTVSMSLAYGLKGFKWWVGWTMFDIHKVKEGEPPPLSDIGKETSRINATLAAFSPYLAPAWSVEVFNTNPLPTSTRTAPEDYWVRPSGEQIVVGLFKNDEDDGEYIVVGNRDVGKAHEATLTFSTKLKTVSRIDKKTRKWDKLQPVAGEKGQSVKLTVEPGDAELLRVVRPKT